ncbi:50S ribosomal protein L1, partial [Veillonellaceae bacterium M2-4]|nr:50S ribosomal protein L1 [Veillonellaceae bacterium M2-4]
MPKHGKQYLEAAKKVERNKFYSVAEAMKLVKETSY